MKDQLSKALMIAIIFIVFKFAEMRYINKELKPVKTFLKDGILVYLSVLGGVFVMDYMGKRKINIPIGVPNVFTNQPNF